LGGHLVERLIEKNYEVRALTRKQSDKHLLNKLPIELFEGDLSDINSLNGMMEGIDGVIHAGACTRGSLEDYEKSSILGTKNVLELANKEKVKRFIHISSLAVYDLNSIPKNSIITENFEIERHPKKVGPYAYSKVESEKLVRAYFNDYNLPITIIRPGIIFGPRGRLFFPHLGFSLLGGKIIMTIGFGKRILPLTYIDNTCDAIITTIKNPDAVAKTYNIVDPQSINNSQYLKYYMKALKLRSLTLTIPYTVLLLFAFLCEKLDSIPLKGLNLPLSRYRLNSKFKKVRFDGSLIFKELHWYPEVTIDTALQKSFAWYNSEGS
jgi:nucleoside-diphosphate-sugar epimerase